MPRSTVIVVPCRNELERDPCLGSAMGSRVRLLGRDIRRRAVRHYLGRAFATAASLVLELPVYDTQCRAKLFRTAPHLVELFAKPFLSPWHFDVELLARFMTRAPPDNVRPPHDRIIEFPLHEWRDVRGSRQRARDLVRVPLDLLRIRLRYSLDRSTR